MRRLLGAVLALLLVTACTDPSAAPTTTTTSSTSLPPPPGPGPEVQLVTEDYLRRELDLRMGRIWGTVIGEMLLGPVHRYPPQESITADDWDVHHSVVNHVAYPVARTMSGWFYDVTTLTFDLGGYDYDPDAGGVDVIDCHQLTPAGGSETTGEYETFDNSLSGRPLSVRKEFDVTESFSEAIRFAEDIEFSNGVTVTAGTETNGVSAELKTRFGISTSDTQSHSTSTKKSLSLDLTVPAKRIYAVTGGTDTTAVDCTVSIDAVGDWASIEVHAYLAGDLSWQTWCDRTPGNRANLCSLLEGDLMTGGDTNHATMTFNESDAIYRAALGYDVRCPQCAKLTYGSYGRASLAQLANPATRHISFAGIRHTTSSDNATYKIVDVTGHSTDCVAAVLGRPGTPVDEVEAELARCQSGQT